jgi:hypothetical protein
MASFSKLFELLELRVARLAAVVVDGGFPNHAEWVGTRCHGCSSSVATFVTP